MKTHSIKPVLFLVVGFSMAFASKSFARADKETYHGAMKNIPHAVITFDKGSAMFTDEEKSTVREMVQKAEKKGRVNHVAVVAWSDKALPPVGQSLPDADFKLAKDRADVVSKYLAEEKDVGSIDTYNMAESSNWLARTFQTSAAELKSIFSKKGARAPVTNAEFRLIKNEGGPGEAVIVVFRD